MIDYGMQAPPQAPEQTAPVPSVTESVTTRTTGTVASSYLLKPSREWTWQDLRDYIITEHEQRFGPQARNPAKESGILKSFIVRHGIDNAVLVAMAAFEVYGGTWKQTPVKITRFTKNSDPFFADVILSRISS